MAEELKADKEMENARIAIEKARGHIEKADGFAKQQEAVYNQDTQLKIEGKADQAAGDARVRNAAKKLTT